jgi:hypothetical protein
MTSSRWFIAAALIVLILTGVNVATAQIAAKTDDLTGTPELISMKDLKPGFLVYGIGDNGWTTQTGSGAGIHYTYVPGCNQGSEFANDRLGDIRSEQLLARSHCDERACNRGCGRHGGVCCSWGCVCCGPTACPACP